MGIIRGTRIRVGSGVLLSFANLFVFASLVILYGGVRGVAIPVIIYRHRGCS